MPKFKITVMTLLMLAATPCAHAASVTVNEVAGSFDLETVDIEAGDSIVFANRDDVTHNIQITDESDENKDKGLQKPGQNVTADFPRPGTYKVRCLIHPHLKMTVTVH